MLDRAIRAEVRHKQIEFLFEVVEVAIGFALVCRDFLGTRTEPAEGFAEWVVEVERKGRAVFTAIGQDRIVVFERGKLEGRRIGRVTGTRTVVFLDQLAIELGDGGFRHVI